MKDVSHLREVVFVESPQGGGARRSVPCHLWKGHISSIMVGKCRLFGRSTDGKVGDYGSKESNSSSKTQTKTKTNHHN